MSRRTAIIVYLAFFLSGVAGLVYQVVWSRYLGVLLGGTGAAYIIVLSTFMGGLALGAWLLGGAADRVRRPLRLYVALELGIAVYGALFPTLFDLARAGYIALAHGLEPGSAPVLAIKAVTAVLLVIIPTTVMGGTLPVLGRFMIDRLSVVGDRVAHLYYINSFGAVAGSLLAGFLLIEQLGFAGSVLLAAVLNFAVALLVWTERDAEDRRVVLPPLGPASGAPSPAAPPPPADPDAEVYPARLARLAMIVIAVSGGVSMMYEVVWIRMLALVWGSGTYSFCVMVAAFIFGITLGSFLLTFKRTDRGYYPLLGIAEIMIGVAMLWCMPLVMQLPYVMNQVQGLLRASPDTFPVFQFVKFALCFGVLVLPTVFIGATLPAASKVVARDMATLGRKVGGAFAINTFGTLAGAILGGAVFMPLLGIHKTLLLGIVLNLVLGIVVLVTSPRPFPVGRPRAWATAIALLAIGGAFASHLTWDDRVLVRSVYRQREAFASRAAYRAYVDQGTILSNRDGLDATITAIEWGDGSRVLFINGKPDASVGSEADRGFSGDMPNMVLVAHLPMLIHGDARDVLLVGQGAGTTAGAVAAYPGAHLDMVEIVPEIVEAAPLFAAGNRRFWERDNVRIVIEDARTMMMLSDKEYDVIINEPSNPWVAGNASLFTTEYYETCALRLREGGLIVQWLQFYEMTDASILQIVRTFQKTFPYYTLWELGEGDLAMVGSRTPYTPDFARLARLLGTPNVADDMGLIGMEIPEVLLGQQMRDAARYAGNFADLGALNSEFHPILEYSAQLGFFLGRPAPIVRALDQRNRPEQRGELWSGQYERAAGAPAPPPERWEHALARLREIGSSHQWRGREVLRHWIADHPANPMARGLVFMRGPRTFATERLMAATPLLLGAPPVDATLAEQFLVAVEEALDEQAPPPVDDDLYANVLSALESIRLSDTPHGWRVDAAVGRVLVLVGRPEESLAPLRAAIGDGRELRWRVHGEMRSTLLRCLCDALTTLGSVDEAEELLTSYVVWNGVDGHTYALGGRIDQKRNELAAEP